MTATSFRPAESIRELFDQLIDEITKRNSRHVPPTDWHHRSAGDSLGEWHQAAWISHNENSNGPSPHWRYRIRISYNEQARDGEKIQIYLGDIDESRNIYIANIRAHWPPEQLDRLITNLATVVDHIDDQPPLRPVEVIQHVLSGTATAD